MLHKQTFSAVKKKRGKKLGKSFLLIKSSARKGWLLMHIRSHSELFLYLVLYSPHTHTQASRGCRESLLHITPTTTPTPPSLSRSEMSGLDVGYHSAPVSGTAPNCARDLSSAFWSFLSVSTPLCFPGGGNQPRTILWLKQGQQGEPMQRKSCRNIQRKTQHLTLMWKLLN